MPALGRYRRYEIAPLALGTTRIVTGWQSEVASPEQNETDAEQNQGRKKANSQEAHGVSPFFLSERMEHARETELEPQ